MGAVMGAVTGARTGAVTVTCDSEEAARDRADRARTVCRTTRDPWIACGGRDRPTVPAGGVGNERVLGHAALVPTSRVPCGALEPWAVRCGWQARLGSAALVRGPIGRARYTPDVPSQTIALALGYINWTLLVSLALGSFGVVVLLRLTTDATRGFLGFTAGSAAVLGLLALLTDMSLDPPDGLAIVAAPGLVDTLRQVALLIFSVASAVFVVALRRGSRSSVVGLVGLTAGVTALALASFGWAPSWAEAVPLLLQFLVLAVATGGSLAALVLGHWYLVTPRLSQRPLVLAARLLTFTVALQVLLFLTWGAFGTGTATGQPPFNVLAGESALFVWLRLIVSLLGPLILGYMAVRTARSRSMESATGLLYIALAAVVSGTIVAAGLAYGSGLLV